MKRDPLYSIPTSNRSLIILVIRKLLASSSFALIETFEVLKKRLENEDYRMYAALSEDVMHYSFTELQEQITGKTEEELKAAFCNINTESDYRNYVK